MVNISRAAAVLTAAACSMALVSTPAGAQDGTLGSAAPEPLKVIAKGLNGPFEVSYSPNRLYVTESDIGQVTEVNPRTGKTQPVVTGLGAHAAAGAVRIGNRFAIVTGETDPSLPAGPQPASSVLVARRGHAAKPFANLLAYELKHNPDGQTQFGKDGKPLEALSNPFYVLRDRSRHGFVLVADGGANDVLRVDRRGKVSTFFVPPTVNTGACKGRPNNDSKTVGCDAVPTGLAYGRHNTLYVSALTGDAPGEGRVYVLNAATGKLKRVLKGFTAPTGVAVDKRTGTVYVSELLAGAPAGEGPPPEEFDPSEVGRIVKVTRCGTRTYAQVTMPVGLLFSHRKLYSSAWSVAGTFFGMPDTGQLVRIRQRAFVHSS